MLRKHCWVFYGLDGNILFANTGRDVFDGPTDRPTARDGQTKPQIETRGDEEAKRRIVLAREDKIQEMTNRCRQKNAIVFMYITSKRIELESACWSGFEAL